MIKYILLFLTSAAYAQSKLSLTWDSLNPAFTSKNDSLQSAGASSFKNNSNAFSSFFKNTETGRMHLINIQMFSILNKKNSFREHELLLAPKYAFYLNSFLPEQVRKITGRWAVQAGGGWVYTIKKLPKLLSKYPVLAFIGGRWELNYFPYITPYIDLMRVYNNPLQQNSAGNYLKFRNTKTNKLYLFSIGFFASFDILDQYFSTKMDQEYGIENMGIFIELQRYTINQPLSMKTAYKKGYAFGVYCRF